MTCPAAPNTKALLWKCFCLVVVVVTMVSSESDAGLTPSEIDNTLRVLLGPESSSSIQARFLRQELLRLLQQGYAENYYDQDRQRAPNYLNPEADLRDLEASVGGAGYLAGSPQDERRPGEDFKRSLATLAKNGQLPTFQAPDDDEANRGIESLASNGDVHHRRSTEGGGGLYDFYPEKRYLGALARSGGLLGPGKRNVASLVRNNNLPNGKRYIFDDKRNIGSIARQMSSHYEGKRNVAAMLRQDDYLNKMRGGRSQVRPTEFNDSEIDKRNLASLKAQMKPKFKRSVDVDKHNASGGRAKRQSDYSYPNEEYPVPVYQNSNVYDYEELIRALTGEYPATEKRFLGSVARSGWFTSPSANRFRAPGKRHIGSLARQGWLPSLRSARRYGRSGRSLPLNSCRDEDEEEVLSRPYSADGTSEDDAEIAKDTLMADKRYLLVPAVDNILLRRMYNANNNNNNNQMTEYL